MRAPGPREIIVNAAGQPNPVMAAWMRDVTAALAAVEAARAEDRARTEALIQHLIDEAIIDEDWDE